MQGGLLQGMLCGSEDILFRAHKFSNPFLLLVGEDDPICDPKSGKAFYESTSTKDDAKSFVSYKGLYAHNRKIEEGVVFYINSLNCFPLCIYL